VTNPSPGTRSVLRNQRSRGGRMPQPAVVRALVSLRTAQEMSCQFIARMELIGESQHSGDCGWRTQRNPLMV